MTYSANIKHFLLTKVKTVKDKAPDRLTLFLLLILVGLWFFYSKMEILAQPDFYKYYFQSERLFKLDFTKMIIPPLFPFLLGIVSKIIHFFISSETIPLWAGRSISLMATIGCLYHLRILAKNFYTSGHQFFLWFLCLSHLFLCFHSTPITEMVFLFFFLGTLTSILKKIKSRTITYAILGALTRFEGILLLIIAGFFVIKSLYIRRKSLIIILSVFCGSVITIISLFVFFFSERMQYLFIHINSTRSIGYFISKPNHLLNLIYSNIFFFLPAPAPFYFQIIVLTALLLLFVNGIILIHKHHSLFAWSCLFFIVSFFLSKGYLSHSNIYYPNTRRVLYPIVLILLIAFWGLQHLFNIASRKNLLPAYFTVGSIFSLFLIAHIPDINRHFNVITTLAVLPAITSTIRTQKKRNLTVFNFFFSSSLIFLLSFLFNFSFWMGYDYLNSSPNKGAFAIAQYINSKPEIQPLLLCTESDVLQYYLKNNVSAKWISIGEKSENVFISILKDRVNDNLIRNIAFDYYLSYPEATVTIDKTHLMRLTNRKDLFFIKPLRYKGQNVAFILTPKFKTSPILSPSDGDTWKLGESQIIKWNANALYGNIVIELTQNNELKGIIGSNVPSSTGSFPWIVGKLENGDFITGNSFKIRIRSGAKALTITSPLDGEKLIKNEKFVISWTPNILFGNLIIEILKDHLPAGIISSGTDASAGFYEWNVGSIEENRTVSGEKLSLRIRTAMSPITIISPSDGERWRLNEIRKIRWLSQQHHGSITIELLKKGSIFGTIRSNIPVDAGSYPWVVGETERGFVSIGDDYSIAIRPSNINSDEQNHPDQ